MDYVYTCRSGKNEELRYSLRTIEKNMPEGNVWVVGYRPDWYIGNFIKVEDIGNKFDNIINCIKIISKNSDISENFVFMNDDFFALNTIPSIKNFNGGLLIDKIERYKELRMSSKYIRLLELTYKQLKNFGIKNPIDYEIHVPMTMNKILLANSMAHAFFPRSAYGNIAKIGGEKINDVKIYGKEKIKNNDIFKKDFISTEDNSFIYLKTALLEKTFTTPSRFENPIY